MCRKETSFFEKCGIMACLTRNTAWPVSWATTESAALPAGVEFVPMCWGKMSIDNFASQAVGATHVLSFNEPDLGEQADMSVAEAAQGHIQALNPLASQGVLISSPAVTNGGAPMGLSYLDNWFRACAGDCIVNFIAVHWYDNADNFEYFKQHINDAIKTANSNSISKIWVTEFGVTGGDEVAFIQKATEFLDATPEVERYAYFMASQGKLLDGSGLSAAGRAYVGLT